MDLIDRTQAIQEMMDEDVDHAQGKSGREVIQILMDLPDAQPEIIRCKDCAKHEYCRTSTVWAIPPKDDWYCADAERREG